ncbi:S-adenosylmethionine synthetase [Haloarcula marismortui ATCC 43049]|uniref:S-adenosylmethionine synthase n=2 Tax=Haloarcula marismortui (strain ATCC 43049 / DSM 3752 / JCM 8966 / VKM B-1809) TaxID=272569 RepID=METK_HALMA|nr:methionine adenosyltransferase [Haloarcula marismortui]Q5V2S5.1 RecName: Full=S-adenosylmethionine synthase; Short=AdoMet synthase; AltName: Full=Methionine adenosyltransferase [Haloarcula marismortui ATCC 43049]AAV46177.1 S-adenosylmethionine synthetase [Haloarcula marismortui ATCC 43049]QCP90933.1 methionine adenosyltransferase [Haloarcula marismortui ATCC 43049]
MTERNIHVQPASGLAVEDQDIEVVERKGIGHPDTICDGIAETVSRALAQTYIDRFGTVLHYNTDETQLVAGTAAPAYGGGEVLEPIYILVVGRATKKFDGERIPAESIALRAARDYLDEQFPHLDLGSDVIVDVQFGEGSGDLQTVFGEEAAIPMANDTSYGVGHAPLTETEQIVRNTEQKLTGEYAESNPVVGQDVKVMGKREGDHIDVTVAVAMVDEHVPDLDAYKTAVSDVRAFVTDLAEEYTDRDVTVHVNTADDYDAESIYLTTTGTSAEQGDDGSVGRGNRANGLITPNRPMSMEATSGKNPVNHIGKIYNLLSTEIAQSVANEVDGIRQVQMRLLSQIGSPIDEPHVADATVVTEDGVAVGDVEADIQATIDDELADVTDITRQVIEGDLSTF